MRTLTVAFFYGVPLTLTLLLVVLVACFFAKCVCDASKASSRSQAETSALSPTWRKIECPYYGTNSGLYKISDPVAGNTVYLHIGSKESSLCAIPGSSAGRAGPEKMKKIDGPYYGTTSGLFTTVDPDNGNTIYLHIGSKESSLFVMPPKDQARELEKK